MKATARTFLSLTLFALAWAAASTVAVDGRADITSIVRINGVATPVSYNDGDTFRALAGPYRRRAARLAGFNTLESYGTVHRWGGWTYRELYVNAKMATYHARRGIWNCDVDGSKLDGYGRILAICLDLGESHLRHGYAHAYSIGDPAHPRLIAAQREAIVERRGMWAKGVPAAVLTSLHSVDERFDNENNYNRLISPLDGISTKWKHQDAYSECQEVCHPNEVLTLAQANQVIGQLRDDPATEPIIRGYEDPYLWVMLNEYATMDRVAQIFSKYKGHETIKAKLDAMKKAGAFPKTKTVPGSCMLYATFERRYRIKPKPKCLKQ